jgi:6-phosphogluconolactonase (cycloisomerase 2 family)
MRMKLNKSSQLVLVSAVSLLAALLITACATLTVDFVYVTCSRAAGPNNYGEVDVFEVNSMSGRMRQIPTSPFFSGGRNPVAAAVSSDFSNLYVVNQDDNTIVQFVIGSDGKLYPQNTVNTPGVFPMGVAVSGKRLFVADLYQPLPTCSNASPCSGSVAVFPIKSDDSLDKPVVNATISASYWPLTLPGSPNNVIVPTAINVTGGGSLVYISAYDATAGGGYVFGFSVNSDGSLASLNNGVPFPVGPRPSALASDAGGGHLYVADSIKSVIYGFQISSGLLTQLNGSPYSAGNSPSAIAIDATGKFAYVANAQDSNVTAYTINAGNLSPIGVYTTGIQPVAIGIDPSLNQYLYTANFLGNDVSGFQINMTNGTLLNSQFSPYKSSAQPTAVAAIPHGSTKK